MLSSQLGRVVLGGSTSTEDEMRVAPDEEGGYGPFDDLLEETAARMTEPGECGDRRSGSTAEPG